MSRSARATGLAVPALAGALVGGLPSARADRYEASLHVQPAAGIARVGAPGTDERARVTSVGVSVRFTYGLRHWLAVEAEAGGAVLGEARFTEVPVTISGGATTIADIDRRTSTGRLTLGATLRLGVAWIPTVSAGLGAQLRVDGAGTIAGSGLVPDGFAGGTRADAVAFTRIGLDRRLGRRWVVGASAGASRAFAAPAIDTLDVALHASAYWYPLWQ